jgi:UPF0716 family protein affecting phage T7 exclusion
MIYALVYLFFEVMVFVYCASFLGGFYTFLEIIVSAFIGIFLLKNFKYSLMSNVKDLASGQISQADFVKLNVAKAIGAFLLVMPGFLTDIIGLLLQFGFVTLVLTKIFKFKVATNFKDETNKNYTKNETFNEEMNFKYTKKRRYDDDEIIDVEVTSDSKSIKY